MVDEANIQSCALAIYDIVVVLYSIRTVHSLDMTQAPGAPADGRLPMVVHHTDSASMLTPGW